MKPAALFAYGVLMHPEILSVLIRQHGPTSPAVLAGYRRVGVELPGWLPLASVVPDAHAQVEGVLIRGLGAETLRLLDAFENVGHGLYTRAKTLVQTPGGGVVAAQVYLPGPALKDVATTEWDYSVFLRRGFRDYRDRIVQGFLRRYRRARRPEQGLW